MAQVIHTGQGMYTSSGLGFNPQEFMQQAGADAVKLEQYRQALYTQREQEFLKLTSVDTENLVFERFQDKAKGLVDDYTKEAVNVFKAKKGVLSTEDKMQLMKKRQEIDMQVGGMQAKAKQFLAVMDAYRQDGGVKYNPEDTMAGISKFIKDPVNSEIPSLIPQYINPIQKVSELADKMYKRMSPTDISRKVEGENAITQRVRYRTGIQNEDDAKKALKRMLDEDYQLRRSFNRIYLQQGKSFDDLYNDTKESLLPEYTQSLSGKGGGLSLGLGGARTLNFSTSDTGIADKGIAMNITGDLPKMNFTIGGQTKSGTLRQINESGIEVVIPYPNGTADTSSQGAAVNPKVKRKKDETDDEYNNRFYELQSRMAANKLQLSQDKVIQGDDGKWYKKVYEKTVSVTNPDEIKVNIDAIRAGIPEVYRNDFERIYNQWLKKVKSKQKKSVEKEPVEPTQNKKKTGVVGTFFEEEDVKEDNNNG